ncbi:MAG: NADH-quinone oxidoreductase subunit C [Bacteroidetes bacterium]|nr:NADH-quinone oxidoreductase subunit C [Bacteroidota bacterium]MBU1422430.1 NADH-quinone oxidoreductase subunit C [Bacteroidota bacterium]MBU2471475.1 NADH-quinone oxidoreductase subunit C [Bacteroidota bacterium]MBU2635523.1 NADH-quinone oxidoreductase subunit C [Bacteroidota bacterium]
MENIKQALLDKLTNKFSSFIVSKKEFQGDLTVEIKKEKLLDICTFLRDDFELSFEMCKDVVGVDYNRPESRFEVVYNLYSLKNKFRFLLKVKVDESDLHVPSVVNIWPGANWPEREVYDFFGIIYDGHPDLRRIYMPEEFEHYPLRKEFPLMGIPGSIPLPYK